MSEFHVFLLPLILCDAWAIHAGSLSVLRVFLALEGVRRPGTDEVDVSVTDLAIACGLDKRTTRSAIDKLMALTIEAPDGSTLCPITKVLAFGNAKVTFATAYWPLAEKDVAPVRLSAVEMRCLETRAGLLLRLRAEAWTRSVNPAIRKVHKAEVALVAGDVGKSWPAQVEAKLIVPGLADVNAHAPNYRVSSSTQMTASGQIAWWAMTFERSTERVNPLQTSLPIRPVVDAKPVVLAPEPTHFVMPPDSVFDEPVVEAKPVVLEPPQIPDFLREFAQELISPDTDVVPIAEEPETTVPALEPLPDPSLPDDVRIEMTRDQLSRGVFDHAANAAYCIAKFPHLREELAELEADDVDDLLEEDGE